MYVVDSRTTGIVVPVRKYESYCILRSLCCCCCCCWVVVSYDLRGETSDTTRPNKIHIPGHCKGFHCGIGISDLAAGGLHLIVVIDTLFCGGILRPRHGIHSHAARQPGQHLRAVIIRHRQDRPTDQKSGKEHLGIYDCIIFQIKKKRI